MKHIILLLILFGFSACSNEPQVKNENIILPSPLDVTRFDHIVDGKKVQLFTLKNKNGLLCEITNYGGRVVSLWTPDDHGNFKDIVMGYDYYEGYLGSNEPYFGALIGRYANRIAQGGFKLNGKQFYLQRNNGNNHLHGGGKGFNNVVWDAILIDNHQLELYYESPTGEEGYPGNLKVKVLYSLTNKDELKIEYWATTDATTLVNLTHHSFFNLQGAGNEKIGNHILKINADFYTPVDSTLIPTGEIATVENTPFDFRTPAYIGEHINADFEQLKFGNGYDHNFVLNKTGDELVLAAQVSEPITGRTMEVFTNEPGLQLYTGNFLDGKDKGKNREIYSAREAFCLETQHFPDSPNHSNFPSTILNPGDDYYSICIYKFGVK